ncbi:hypothetical protein GRJ2_001813100 [Grus japonensis]|uniref:Uncharacterized protein n=1 Tax=Grus japonensis TaxID=30415 RepID=A0ABC9X740_GRUJA
MIIDIWIARVDKCMPITFPPRKTLNLSNDLLTPRVTFDKKVSLDCPQNSKVLSIDLQEEERKKKNGTVHPILFPDLKEENGS